MAANLKLNSTGGGSISFDPGSTASNLTFTFPAAGGQIATSEGSNTFSALTVTGNTYLATASGNVGIGTSSPAAKLNVSKSNAGSDVGIILSNVSGYTNTASTATLYLGATHSGTANASKIVASHSDGTASDHAQNMQFWTVDVGSTPTERMRIDTAGNVGIGTASPNSPAGSTQITLHISNATAGTSPGIHLTNGDTGTATGDGSLVFVGNAAGTGTTSLNVYNQEASPICFFTSTNERMRINAGAPILCLAGGNTSATGTGIAFPATQSASSDANTLDDYEEGTFTPVLYASSSNPTVTYAGSTQGKYTKIGNTVTVSLFLSTTAISGGSGDIWVGNLPFTVASNCYYPNVPVGCSYIDMSASGKWISMELRPSNTTATVMENLDNALRNVVQIAAWGAGGTLTSGFTYMTS